MAALLRLLFLLPPLLLLPSSPVLGNEGAAAGSCSCLLEPKEPLIIKHYPENLQSCDSCWGKLRFVFPRLSVCGHESDAWAQNFWNRCCGKPHACKLPEDSRQVTRAEASQPHQAPTPSSAPAVPTETDLDPGWSTSKEVPRTQLAPGRTTDAPQTPGRATSAPVTDGDPGGAGTSQPSLQEEASPHLGAEGSHRVAVMSLIGVALASVAVTVLVVCQRRRWGRGRHLAHYGPSGHPGEEVRYLPCEET